MAYHKADAKAMLDDRGYAGKLIRGQNPATLLERAVLDRITDSMYFKEQCFGLNAATLCDRATDLQHIGGTYGTTGKPTPFLCLIFKMLQLVPNDDVILEMLNQPALALRDAEEDEDETTETDQSKLGYFKYLRALAAFYIRLAWQPKDIYQTLEPLLADHRKLKRRARENYSLTYMDQFIDDLLTKDRVCATSLWKMPTRVALEDLGELEPYESALGDELDEIDRESQNGHDDGEVFGNGEDRRDRESSSGRPVGSPQSDRSDGSVRG